MIEAADDGCEGATRSRTLGRRRRLGASGKAVGIAGSLALSVLDARSTAVIESGSTVTLNEAARGLTRLGRSTLRATRLTWECGHGLKTGDAVVYKNGGGTDIGGLKDGTTYYVITEAAPRSDKACLYGWGCCCGDGD